MVQTPDMKWIIGVHPRPAEVGVSDVTLQGMNTDAERQRDLWLKECHAEDDTTTKLCAGRMLQQSFQHYAPGTMPCLANENDIMRGETQTNLANYYPFLC